MVFIIIECFDPSSQASKKVSLNETYLVSFLLLSMNIIAFRTIREFYEEHPITENALRTWYTILKVQNWEKPQDAINTFGAKSVDILKNQRLCIDVKGNHIRVNSKY